MILSKLIKLMILICAITFLIITIASCKTQNNNSILKANGAQSNILPVSSNTATSKSLETSIIKSTDEIQKTQIPSDSSDENIIVNSTNNNTWTATPNTSIAAPTPTPLPDQQTNSKNFIKAKFSDPTIDGVINSDEYAATYTMDASNSSNWTLRKGTCPTVNYYFAWSDKGLYVAVKSANLVQFQNIMINLNPNNLIVAGGAGVFFSFIPNANGTLKVLRHNYQTVYVTRNNDGKPAGFDISTKVISKLVESSGISLEIFIPIAELQVKSIANKLAPNVIDATALTIRENDVWGLGTYMLVYDGITWSSLLGRDIPFEELINNIFQVDNLGKITFSS